MKILVVEDDLVTGTLLNKVLTKGGYEVTHAIDGDRALEALQAQSFRIILTDWMMPAMDGPTLCRHIRELNLPQYIFIILVTARSSKDDAVTGLESGADDYIVKPFDKFELLARVRAGRRLVELEDTQRESTLRLSRSEKLAALGHLAAGVAHEINNPIGFITSNLNSLRSYMHDMQTMLGCYRELAQALDQSISQNKLQAHLPGLVKKAIQMEKKYEIDLLIQDTGELIDDCTSGAGRIKAIVHEMRYFAHPEQQDIVLCSLPGILENVTQDFKAELPPGVTIDNRVGILPQIACNATHIQQALTNIMRNAVESVTAGGRIMIEGRHAGDSIEIAISDTGRGIAPEHLSMVFDPFFTTKSVGAGIGLGLTTALNIVRIQNGSITCQSSPGSLTCFTVHLPVSGEAI